ncbi:MAG: hypothetical protein ACKN9V_07120, partial [Pseudomonadota bacterium]
MRARSVFLIFTLYLGLFSEFAFSVPEVREHIAETRNRPRPISHEWDHHRVVTILLADMKQDGFFKDAEQSKERLKAASKVEAERIETESKHLLIVYEKLRNMILKFEKNTKSSNSSKEKDEIQDLLIEIQGRIVRAQSIRNNAIRRLNDLVLDEFIEGTEIPMEKTVPTLFDDSISAKPKPYRTPPQRTIEP